MKVTLVLPGWPHKPAGGYKVAYQYANYMVNHGHQVTVLHGKVFAGQPVSTSTGGQFKYLMNVGSIVRDVAAVVRSTPPSWYALDPKVKVVNRLRAQVSDVAGADVVVATAVETARFVADAVAGLGSTGAYFIQHFEEWTFGVDAVEETWRLPLHRIVIAPWLADHGTRLGVETALVPNAIDQVEFPPGPAIRDRPLAVGAMISPVHFKRADLLVEVFKRVHAAMPQVQGRAFGVAERHADLPDYVDYVREPTREELSAIYQGVRVYVCASDAEGWHLPPAEAMVSGAAVVSTDISGVRVYAQGNAELVPVGDVNALTEAVLGLLRDEARNAEVAERGQASLTAYSIDDAGAAFTAELERALAKAST